MIVVDANLLVCAHVSTTPQHEVVRSWLDESLNGTAPVGLPWPSLLAFARLVSNPRVFERPLAVREAWRQIEQWLDCRPVWIPQPTDPHPEILASFMRNQVVRASLIPHAHLAALAIEHGLILCTTDGDFGRGLLFSPRFKLD